MAKLDTYPVFVMLVGEGSVELLDQVGRASTMDRATALVEQAGYRVIPCAEGGCCELSPRANDDYLSWNIRVHSLSLL